MNISPTEVGTSSTPFPSYLSGDLMDRMRGTLANNAMNADPSITVGGLGKGNQSSAPKAGGFTKLGVAAKLKELTQSSAGPSTMGVQAAQAKLSKAQKAQEIEEADTEAVGTSEPDESGADGKKKRIRKKWKKPKDKPNRPLSAYNLFFQAERASMLGGRVPVDTDKNKKRIHRRTHGKVGFAEMARVIGTKWKQLPDEDKKVYIEQAAKEKKRYAKDLAVWKEQQKAKADSNKQQVALEATEPRQEKPTADDFASASGAGLSNMGAGSADALRMQLMTEDVNRRNLSLLQQHPSQEMPSTLEYLRLLQDRRAERAALLGRSALESNIFQYPSAAEASANAILQQFQNMQQLPAPSQFRGLQSQGMQQLHQMAPSNSTAFESAGIGGMSEFDRLQAQLYSSRYQNNVAAAAEMHQLGSSQRQSSSPFDMASVGAAGGLDRLQQLRLQAANANLQEMRPGPSSGSANGPQSQFDFAAAMRRLQQRYNM